MKDKEESKTKKLGRFLGKKAVEAGNIIDKELRKAGKIAREEFKEFDIGNVVVEPSKKPKGESRIEFTRRTRPIKTFAQANRTVQFFSRNPEKKEMNPGIDGLVSFSILIAPFAILIGLLILIGLDELLAILFLFLYAILIAIPGAYLGIDSIIAGAQSVIRGGTTTIVAIARGFVEFLALLARGIIELFLLFINALFGFAKGAFETLSDYVVFVVVYTIFAGGIWLLTINLLPLYFPDYNISLILLGFIVLLPALLPASVAHRYWLIWRLNRKSTTN